MAYSPRSDLLTPSVAPDTQGYGPGITAGMNNFSSLVQQGLANKRQDQRDQKIWEQNLSRDNASTANAYGMMDRREMLADKRDATSKQDLSEFSMGMWESMKSQKPDLITPEINEKFYGANANTRNALALAKQRELAVAMKSQQEENERAAKAKAANTWSQVPGSNHMINGNGSVIPKGYQDYGPAAAPYQGDGSNMWEGQGPTLDGPVMPSYFSNMPDRPVSPSARPAPTPTPAPTGLAPTSPAGYYRRY